MVTLLEARSVELVYGGELRALDDVSFRLAAGELVTLLGPNGSGKSSLLGVLAGNLRATRGEVRLGERNLAELPLRARAREIAWVPQALAGLPGARVRDFVSSGRYAHLGFWRRPCGADRAAVERAMEWTEVSDLAQRPWVELSGGQRQRVLIARALAQEAKVLLFDEPTASLDPQHQIQLFDLIRSLVDEGCGAVVVTHEFHLASRYGDRCVLLENGRQRGAGTPWEVLRQDVLEPVFGENLLYLSTGNPRGRPLVVPWPGRG